MRSGYELVPVESEMIYLTFKVYSNVQMSKYKVFDVFDIRN